MNWTYDATAGLALNALALSLPFEYGSCGINLMVVSVGGSVHSNTNRAYGETSSFGGTGGLQRN